jgi:AcrR family transcriptional regulator
MKLNQKKVFNAVLKLIDLHHPTSITFSMISRRSGVPRATLYYYFGKDVDSLVQESVRYGMKTFVRLFDLEKSRKYADWSSFQYHRLYKAVKLVQRYPWIPTLYFRYRNTQEDWGKSIREIETEYAKSMSKEWKKFHGKEPSWAALHISSYYKLGLLWGLASDSKEWAEHEDSDMKKWVEESTRAITQILQR